MNCFVTSLCEPFLVAPETHDGENEILKNSLDFEVRAQNKTIPLTDSA